MRFGLLFLISLLTACSSTDAPRYSYDKAKRGSVEQLISYSKSLLGTPYKYGGSSPQTRFDCSGYVGHVFDKIAGISLPRTAPQISQHGYPVKFSQLREGDLVFFDTNGQSYSHVGIYLGNGRFINAPSSGGSVRVENMKLDYWKKHYNGARRITF